MLVTRNEKKLASPLVLLRIKTLALFAEVESSIRAKMLATLNESLVVVERTICVTEDKVPELNFRFPLPGLPELVDVEKA